jgi:4-oxalocrotonate tautomerase
MPIVNVKVIEDVFTPAQKQEMIQKLTDAMVSIEGETMRQVTWVYTEDVKQGEFGIGGQPLTAADVQRLQRGEAAA